MSSLPHRFIERVKSELPNHDVLINALESDSPVSIRINPIKPNELIQLDFEG